MNRELLIHAYEILDGIPQKNFDLNLIAQKGQGAPTCGTLACGLGWLAMHPDFKALGLDLWSELQSSDSCGLIFQGRKKFPSEYGDTAAALFGIFRSDGYFLFGTKTCEECHSSDKAALLSRIRNYLKENT